LFQHPGAGFSNDLDDLVSFYRGYRALMNRAIETWPARIFTVPYAGLVESTRTTIKSVLKYLDAPGSKQAMATDEQDRPVRTASAWQARQPVHKRSLARWKNYSDQAPEFFAQLKRIDLDYD
jgi:hypothetical protein